jgi:hypothetical protein
MDRVRMMLLHRPLAIFTIAAVWLVSKSPLYPGE